MEVCIMGRGNLVSFDEELIDEEINWRIRFKINIEMGSKKVEVS